MSGLSNLSFSTVKIGSALPKLAASRRGGSINGGAGEVAGGQVALVGEARNPLIKVQILWILTKTLTPSNHDLPFLPLLRFGDHQTLLQIFKMTVFSIFTENSRINIFWDLIITNLCEVIWPNGEKIHGAEQI